MTYTGRVSATPSVSAVRRQHPMATNKLAEADTIIFKILGQAAILVVGKHFFQYVYETCLSHEGNMQINPDFLFDFCWSHFRLRNQPKKTIMEQVDICIMLGSSKPEWSTTDLTHLLNFKSALQSVSDEPIIEVISAN